jgi:hypothetical protein
MAPAVELFGPPAAGKSSVARALGELPGIVVVKDHRPADLPALALGAARAWPVLHSRRPSGVGRTRWVAWGGRLDAAPYVVHRHRRAGARGVLLDQGPAYTLGRLAAVRRDAPGMRWWSRRIAACAGLLDGLVLLHAGPEALAERLRARDKQHLARDLPDTALLRYLADEAALCAMVADAVEAAGGRVLRLVTTSATVGDHVAAVTALLAEPATEGVR